MSKTLIDVDDVVGIGEIARMAGVSGQAVNNWRARHDDFPKPVKQLLCGSLFDRNEISAWLERATTQTRRMRPKPAKR